MSTAIVIFAGFKFFNPAGATHCTPAVDGGGMAGYETAWFAAQFMDDEFARGAFYGNCEICGHRD